MIVQNVQILHKCDIHFKRLVIESSYIYINERQYIGRGENNEDFSIVLVLILHCWLTFENEVMWDSIQLLILHRTVFSMVICSMLFGIIEVWISTFTNLLYIFYVMSVLFFYIHIVFDLEKIKQNYNCSKPYGYLSATRFNSSLASLNFQNIYYTKISSLFQCCTFWLLVFWYT